MDNDTGIMDSLALQNKKFRSYKNSHQTTGNGSYNYKDKKKPSHIIMVTGMRAGKLGLVLTCMFVCKNASYNCRIFVQLEFVHEMQG